MAIRIKRSSGNAAPSSLSSGQLAYVEGTVNGGTLYYGEIGGDVREIGGRKFVDKLNTIETGAQVNTVTSVNTKVGAVVLSTKDVGEDTNLYYTDNRARLSVSVTDAGGDGSLSYNNTTGVITYTGPSAAEVRAHFSAGTGITVTDGVIATTITQYTDSLAKAAISVTDSGGDGSLSYNNTTGVITYIGPSATEVRAHFSAGTGITITDGEIATTITQYTDTAARLAVSVTDAGGDGSLSYNNTTGVITYTGPSATEVRAHFSAGSNISITDGVVAFTGLGYTAEDTANKGQPNGYASLDSSGKVPSTQLPSYVDDVLEFANLAAFPVTGETDKIYVAKDTNKTYRWSGSTYIEISASPGSTDAVPEGSVNLYFTQARARNSISVTQNLTYDAVTGLITGPDLSGYALTSSLITTFTGLTDTPANYTGAANYFVKVNGSATALEFTPDIDDGIF